MFHFENIRLRLFIILVKSLCLNDVRELHETELHQEFGASELRLESFCQKPLGLQTKLGIAVKRERARQSLHAQIN